MSVDDIIAIAVLLLAYGITWALFRHSLKIVEFIHAEKLGHARQIQERLKQNRTKHISMKQNRKNRVSPSDRGES